MKVSIFGLGYVGCVTAACLSRDGHEVVGVDIQPSRVKLLTEGIPTVLEPGLKEILRDMHKLGRLTATTDGYKAVLETEVSIICVGTPNNRDGSLDLRAVRATAKLIGQAMMEKADRHVVILRSTVPAGTCQDVLLPAMRATGAVDAPEDSNVVIVPEFLREGTAIADYDHPPFVVAGTASGTADRNEPIVSALFGGVTEAIEWVSYREAEVLKAICNVFHALKVSFANEIGSLCQALGSDGHAVMNLLVKDTKLNISKAYMRPGLPFGGSCLPKDLRMMVNLGTRHAVDLPLLSSILPSNEAHLHRALELVSASPSRKVGLYGLAFKSDTDDLRESPLVTLAEHLIGKGYDLKIYDPALEASLAENFNHTQLAERLPHLYSRLVSSMDELLEHSETLLVSRDQQKVRDSARSLGRNPAMVDLCSQGTAPIAEPAREVTVSSKRKPFSGTNGRNGKHRGNLIPQLLAA
jgi:GDP-mannose 6-dehydrogenase